MNVLLSAWRIQSRFRRSRDFGAFSLVEVVIALGVIAFGLMAIVALVPVGIHAASDSLEESQAVNVLSAVVADRQATPLGQVSSGFSLPGLSSGTTTKFFGVNEAQQSTDTNLSKARYRIDYAFYPPAAGTLNPYLGYFRASWPAAASNPASFVEIVAAFPQP